MKFESREDAGERLGQFLREKEIRADVVLGLPRGGVVVAAAVAHVLQLPLDVIVVRKIGHPWQREFAVGALGDNGVVVLDQALVGRNPLLRSELEEIIAEEKERLNAYQERFRHGRAAELKARSVLIVDDGLATGATTEAAVLSARKQNARQAVVAAPVASTSAVERLQRVADDVYALFVDPEFDAVGRYYESFSQTSDEEVTELLRPEVKY